MRLPAQPGRAVVHGIEPPVPSRPLRAFIADASALIGLRTAFALQGIGCVSPSPPHFVWRPCNAAEQVAPDRPTAIHLGVLLARRDACRAALVSAQPLAHRPLFVFPQVHRFFPRP
ncbi:MAG: hypothetical protein EPO43_13645 [Rugosibacter sp.]|nr:MAG: hypothetical protein EPO43_13645 [Rugosibacter sp.]